MAGIKIQKNYVSSNYNLVSLANNWTVLVLGITSKGPYEPTLCQNYSDFLDKFGQPVTGLPTHFYVKFLLDNNVPVLFRRIVGSLGTATYTYEKNNKTIFKIVANEDEYDGNIGNNIVVTFTTDKSTGAMNMQVYYNDTGKDFSGIKDTDKNLLLVESYFLGTVIGSNAPDLLREFVSKASTSNLFNSKYIKFKEVTDSTSEDDWTIASPPLTCQLTEGSGGTVDLQDAIANILLNSESPFWNDTRLNNAPTYYPQVRFLTTGGITSTSIEGQNTININLGKFANKCQDSFRVLIDYPLGTGTKDIENVVRNFAITAASSGIDPSIYAYFGDWGYDSMNNPLPGSAGFLSALGREGYDVYSRRVAGTAFNPGFTKTYNKMFIDSINSWQDETKVQLNPIVNIDAQNNLAVMGSSTLALPLGTLNSKNPKQALDIVLVGDYITAILNNIALGYLDATIDRLTLNMLSSAMSVELESFVTSGAISRYGLNFNIISAGKLNIECTLYFPVGLDEITLTVTSVYDTDIV